MRAEQNKREEERQQQQQQQDDSETETEDEEEEQWTDEQDASPDESQHNYMNDGEAPPLQQQGLMDNFSDEQSTHESGSNSIEMGSFSASFEDHSGSDGSSGNDNNHDFINPPFMIDLSQDDNNKLESSLSGMIDDSRVFSGKGKGKLVGKSGKWGGNMSLIADVVADEILTDQMWSMLKGLGFFTDMYASFELFMCSINMIADPMIIEAILEDHVWSKLVQFWIADKFLRKESNFSVQFSDNIRSALHERLAFLQQTPVHESRIDQFYREIF